jgi:ubiquinone/menaquinone biosynthesis C-methylase UbiE
VKDTRVSSSHTSAGTQPASDSAAEAYITDRYRLWRGLNVNFDYKQKKAERIARIMADSGGLARTALEIGVGPAGIAVELSRRGMKILGMDISPDALERARVHSRGEDVALLRGSGFNLPLRSGSLSLVYASQVFHLFESPQRLALMHEIHRVLTPGGRLLFDMKNAWSHLFKYVATTPERRRRNYPPHDEVLGLLRQAGFGSVTLAAGVLPGLGPVTVPDVSLFRQLAHTTFYIGRRDA